QFPITATTNASMNEARFQGHTSGQFAGGVPFAFDLTLRAPNGQPLVPGTYPNATSTGEPPRPYISHGAGGTCQSTGSFAVHEAVYGAGPSIVRFFASYEIRCAANPGTLRAQIS